MADRPRDSQLSKFFTAEHQMIGKLGTVFRDQDDANLWFRRVLRLNRWKKYEQAGLIYAAPTRINFDADTDPCNMTLRRSVTPIMLGPLDQNSLHVLHVLAHHAAPADVPLHGPEFVKIFLDLVGRYEGLDAKREAKDILVTNRVKTKKYTPDTRLKQRDAYMDRQTPAAREKLEQILAELEGDDDADEA